MQQALAMADPSEPKYCHCQRISFGEMIACENPGACMSAAAAVLLLLLLLLACQM